MVALNQTFDATTVEPAAPREVIPPGKYIAQIVNSEMRQTKDGMGEFLSLELEVAAGEYKGRHLFDRLNLVNNSAEAVEIARRTFSSICHAIGILKITNSEQLHYHDMQVTVKVRAPTDKYAAQNEIRGYEAAGGQAPAAALAKAAPVAVAKPANAPWRRAG